MMIKQTSYYPYGEPWREPSAASDNRYLFGGKEREHFAGLRLYDYGPRMLNAAAAIWTAMDRRTEDYTHLSPFSYCAGNPVRYIDPTKYQSYTIRGF